MPRALRLPLLLALTTGLLAGAARAQAQPDPPPVHDPPYGLTLDAREPGRVQLVWVPAEDNRGVTVRSYLVWRRTGSGPWEQLASLGPEVTWYSDRRVTGGDAYSYRVTSLAAPTGPLALPPEVARRQSEPVGPVLALEPWYVSVESVAPEGGAEGPEGAAVLRVHRWLADTAAWDTCAPFGVRTGAPIGAAGLAGDFRTGAALVAVWQADDASGEPVGWIRYRLEDGREQELSTRDAPPEEVWKEAPPSRKRRAPPPVEEETQERPPAPKETGPTATKPLRFPEPQRLEQVEGKKVLWEIVNQTPYRLSVYYDGPSVGRALVEPGETTVLRLVRGGDYAVLGRAASTDRVLPAEGKFSLQSGWRYRSAFVVTTTPPKKPGER